MSPANPQVAASVRARLLNVAKAQGVDFNLDSVVERAHQCRDRRARQGVTTLRATARKEEQRRMVRRAR